MSAVEVLRMRDPRHFQIIALTGLLLYGTLFVGFDVKGTYVVAALGAAMVSQFVATRVLKLERFDPRSALISGLSICLLLRSASIAWVVIAAVIAIASKFIVRSKGKHVFNPTCLALVCLLLATDDVWVSAGQWGSTTYVAFLVACVGIFVVFRAERSDVTLAFLSFHLAFLVGRALWLQDPMSIPLHQLQNGALVLFAFFMISDPKTTPDSRLGRIAFAFVVAAGAYFVTFVLYEPNGLLYSLAACAVCVRLVDTLLPGHRYVWPTSNAMEASIS